MISSIDCFHNTSNRLSEIANTKGPNLVEDHHLRDAIWSSSDYRWKWIPTETSTNKQFKQIPDSSFLWWSIVRSAGLVNCCCWLLLPSAMMPANLTDWFFLAESSLQICNFQNLHSPPPLSFLFLPSSIHPSAPASLFHCLHFHRSPIPWIMNCMMNPESTWIVDSL